MPPARPAEKRLLRARARLARSPPPLLAARAAAHALAPAARPAGGAGARRPVALLVAFAAAAAGWATSPAALPCAARRTGRVALAAEGDGAGELGGAPLPRVKVRAPRRLKKGEPNAIRGGGGTRRPAGGKEMRKQGKEAAVRDLQRLYITGGAQRGRRIRTPDIYLRPMMSRVREALYSILYPTGVLRESASHLDLFAGAGTVGLESLSRGVGKATFVDFASTCAKTIRANAASMGLEDRTRVIEARVDAVLNDPARFGLDAPFELVTMTPPYEEVVYAELMEALASSPVLAEDSLVAIEYPVELGCFPPVLASGKLVGLRNRRYGRTVLAIYVCRPSGRLDYPPRSEEFVTLEKK